MRAILRPLFDANASLHPTRAALMPTLFAVYVSRNTYIRVGAAELHRTNTVHLACYYRYYRFFPNGQVRGARSTLWRAWQGLGVAHAQWEMR